MDAEASLSVDEIELGCGDYKVVERASVADDLFENSQETSPQRGRQSSIHIVKPDMQWCSCGVWQDFMYPCRHGCHPYHKFGFVKQTFRSNFFQ